MVTIKDVAAKAGVSTATVSRAMSGNGQVNEETRLRVLAAVEELGYVPNAFARGLKTRQSRLIGMILPDIEDPFFAQIAAGIEKIALDHGFQVLYGNSLGRIEREAKHIETMLSRNVDGFILSTADDPLPPAKHLLDMGIPCVLLDDVPKGSPVDGVQVDNFIGMRMLVDHLLDLGHRRIGFIAGRVPSQPARERIDGFCERFVARGLPVPDDLIRPGGWAAEEATTRTLRLLEDHPETTALIGSSTMLTVGLMRGLRAAGLRVPEDVSVASFDDVPIAADLNPFLTAVRQPVDAMCAAVCDLLNGRIFGTRKGDPELVVVPPDLHVRVSTKAITP
ncbi:MAG: LacI family DNA-binding transcriptional regulator [Chloroflexota bacterium]